MRKRVKEQINISITCTITINDIKCIALVDGYQPLIVKKNQQNMYEIILFF